MRTAALALLLLAAAAAVGAPPTRVNPHWPTPGSDPRSSCSACHTERPNDGASPADAQLRLEPVAVCSTCHPGMPHQGAAEHVGRPMPDRARAALASIDGRITCFTCHDVHVDGAAGDVSSPVARRLGSLVRNTDWAGRDVTLPGLGEGRPSMLRQPLEDGTLCRTCHGVGP